MHIPLNHSNMILSAFGTRSSAANDGVAAAAAWDPSGGGYTRRSSCRNWWWWWARNRNRWVSLRGKKLMLALFPIEAIPVRSNLIATHFL